MCRIYRSNLVIWSASCILLALFTHFSSSSMICGHSLFTSYDLLTIARLFCCHAHLEAYCIMFGLSILIALVRTGKYFTLNSNRARLSRAASRFPFAFLASRSRHGLSSTDYIKLHSKNITKRLLREGEREDERAKRAACMRPAETSGSVMLNFAHIR